MNIAQLLRWLIEERFQNPLTESLKKIFDNFEQVINLLTTYNKNTIARLEKLEAAIMGKLEDNAAATSAQIDALKAQQTKALGEIRTALDKALQVQITPDELAAAVEAAKQAQRTADRDEFDSQVDAAFAPLTAKITEAQVTTQELDDIVKDAEANPPAVPTPNNSPEGTPTGAGTETDETSTKPTV